MDTIEIELSTVLVLLRRASIMSGSYSHELTGRYVLFLAEIKLTGSFAYGATIKSIWFTKNDLRVYFTDSQIRALADVGIFFCKNDIQTDSVEYEMLTP
jgi:hypothetical protein